MKSFIRCIASILMLFAATTAYNQNTSKVNYLKTPDPLSFNNTAFSLAWTSHPTGQYYKQEYLPKEENLNSFKSMLLLEVVTSGLTPKDAMEAKVNELKAMKPANPFVNFENFYNKEKDEYVLDFVVTANTPDGKDISIAERNVYRYKKYTGSNGSTGVILFGVSKRAYGAEAKKFVAGLTAASRKDLVNKVMVFVYPAITVK